MNRTSEEIAALQALLSRDTVMYVIQVGVYCTRIQPDFAK